MVMIMSRSVKTTVSVYSIGILVVAAGFFLLDIEKNALHYWAFGSLLFSLLVSLLAIITLVLPKRQTGGAFYAAGLNGSIVVYEIAIIVSVIFTESFADKLNGFIFLQIAINACFFVAAILVLTISRHIHDNNAKIYENVQNGAYSNPKRGGF